VTDPIDAAEPTEPAEVPWRLVLAVAAERLEAAGVPSPASDARRIVEEASGWDGAELGLHLDDPATVLTARSFRAMLDRRAAGEPLQYVLGRWGFRTLDLYIDRRVLIPRPETEQVAEAALHELGRAHPDDRPPNAIDLGTGSGAIALSLVAEHSAVHVWAIDSSPDAIVVARANLAGLGQPASRVRLEVGAWFEAVPLELKGRTDLVVANPPYVAASEVPGLPAEVAAWEPHGALVSGPTGLEAIEVIVAGAAEWLARPGTLVVEHAPHQARAVRAMAGSAGFTEVETRRDLSGRDRMVIARR
jgi:release factor glutamine methyltransferase